MQHKHFTRVKRYMIRLILYKAMFRGALALLLSLLWQRYLSDGRFGLLEAPLLLCGVFFLAWAWFGYLSLDGLTIHHLLEKTREEREQARRTRKKRHASRSMVDFADEKIISFDELEPDEQTLASMLANLLLGGGLVLAGAVATLLG